jgi:hypothetical protein
VKKADLIALLDTIPEDAEIVVQGYSCDILGEYRYEDRFRINESRAYGPALQQRISNYRGVNDEEKIVYVLE